MYKVLIASFLFFLSFSLSAQSKSDTTSMVVNGVCGMCKNTIEAAALIDGVSLAVWDKGTKILKLTFNSELTSLAQINEAVIRSGYDTEFEAASDSTYLALDPCCYYRDPNNAHYHEK
jgi:mercuric ion binding protein